MSTAIKLQWKEFKVDLNKIAAYMKENLSSNYDGLICDEESISIVFVDVISEEDQNVIAAYWDSITEDTFKPTTEEIITTKLSNAIKFGNDLLFNAAMNFISLGLNSSGKARLVANYIINLQTYLMRGALFAATEEINYLLGEGVPENLAPFITSDKLNDIKAKIAAFISS